MASSLFLPCMGGLDLRRKVQRRAVAKSLSAYEKQAKSRNEAIVDANASGGYSYQEIGDYFSLHFTRVGKIVRAGN